MIREANVPINTSKNPNNILTEAGRALDKHANQQRGISPFPSLKNDKIVGGKTGVVYKQVLDD